MVRGRKVREPNSPETHRTLTGRRVPTLRRLEALTARTGVRRMSVAPGRALQPGAIQAVPSMGRPASGQCAASLPQRRSGATGAAAASGVVSTPC